MKFYLYDAKPEEGLEFATSSTDFEQLKERVAQHNQDLTNQGFNSYWWGYHEILIAKNDEIYLYARTFMNYPYPNDFEHKFLDWEIVDKPIDEGKNNRSL